MILQCASSICDTNYWDFPTLVRRLNHALVIKVRLMSKDRRGSLAFSAFQNWTKGQLNCNLEVVLAS